MVVEFPVDDGQDDVEGRKNFVPDICSIYVIRGVTSYSASATDTLRRSVASSHQRQTHNALQ